MRGELQSGRFLERHADDGRRATGKLGQGRMDKQQELMGKLMDSVQTIKQALGHNGVARAVVT